MSERKPLYGKVVRTQGRENVAGLPQAVDGMDLVVMNAPGVKVWGVSLRDTIPTGLPN